MKLSKVAAGLLAASVMAGASADSLNEGFDNVSQLAAAGWVFTNMSTSPSLAWFQGNSGIFAAQSGAADSYVGANFNSSGTATGVVDNWLITPVLTDVSGATLTFYTQASDAGFLDKLEVRFSSGSSDVASFTTLVGTVGGVTAYPVGSWMAVTMTLPTAVSGRVAFHYSVANAMDASYIGIDSVMVTAVPEPSSLLMLGLGLAAVGAAKRRRAAAAETAAH